MIILLSIILLVLLVYLGIKIKEGMTLPESGTLITTLNNYYAKKTYNEENKIDNTKNETTTIKAIEDLNLSNNKSIISILLNTDLNDSSKINSIRTLINNYISDSSSNYISMDQYKKMIEIIDKSSTPSKQVIKELSSFTTSDNRFDTVFDTNSDMATQFDNVKNVLYNIVNP